MFATNHFAELAAWIPTSVMQTYVIVMILLVVAGTLYDVMHKQSAKYFSELAEKSATAGDRRIQSSEKMGIAIQTAMIDVATSAEFCNPDRRKAHLLTMYGFIVYLIMTVILVFSADPADTGGPWLVILLWYIGALMVCAGGYWFWFAIRVDVSVEGQSPFRLERADLFVLSLLGCTTFGILWALFQGSALGVIFLILYLIATTVLFGGVPWSKFAHMFFKPGGRLSEAGGQCERMGNGSADDFPGRSGTAGAPLHVIAA